MAEPETIQQSVTALFAAWNRKAPTSTFLGYEMAIVDLPDDAVKHGTARAVREGGEHPPSAPQLRKYCLGRCEDDLDAMAAAAFERADQAARRHGSGMSVRKLDDPLITHAIGAVGGWLAFCKSPIDHWQRHRFIEAYKAAADNPQLEQVAKLSHQGKPIGALQDLRTGVAKELTRLPLSFKE